MHYIRFLKPPSLSQSIKSSKDIQLTTKITITSDLGESFLSVDLPILVVLLDDKDLQFQSRLFLWKAGSRQLEISFSIDKTVQSPKGVLKWPIKVLVQAEAIQNRLETLIQLFKRSTEIEEPPALVLPVLSESVSGINATAISRMAQRVFKLANGELLYIWEENGESIARHIWDAGLLLSAYLDSCCLGQGLSRIVLLPALQKLLSKEQLLVLELGAGCGMVGLTLGKCLPKAKVLLTDLPEAEEISKHNIGANGIRPKTIYQHRSRIQYQKLDWEDPLSDKQREGGVDLVLVADCTYNPDVVPDLVKTLAELLKHNKDAFILLAMKVRHETEKVFFNLMAEKHITIKDRFVLPLPLLGQEFEEVEVYLFAGDPEQYG